MYIEVNPYNPDQRSIDQAVEFLRKGGIVIYPTDSVYSIGADINNKEGLKKLAKFKGIKFSEAKFSIFCESHSQISDYVAQLDRSTFKILKKHLPGPFTFVLPANKSIAKIFSKGKHEIGIRMSSNPIVQSLVTSLGNPLVTTSLIDTTDELTDYFISPTEMFSRFGDQVDLMINGGEGRLEASTVVRLSPEIEIIRQGAGALDI